MAVFLSNWKEKNNFLNIFFSVFLAYKKIKEDIPTPGRDLKNIFFADISVTVNIFWGPAPY